MLDKYLQEIGLSDKEATIYLALLQVESASVLDLSKKTSIKRPTVYVILESLARKGLVSETTVGKKTQYQAEPPERLETFVERQKVVLEDRARILKDMLPQIKSIQRESGERPVVKYFEGRDGIVSSMEELFSGKINTDGEPIYFIYPKGVVADVFTPEEQKRYIKMRQDRKIWSKAIYTWDEGKFVDESTGDRIKVDGKKYPIKCDISIYKDMVRISILGKKLSAIFVKNTDFAETMKSLFKIVFDARQDGDISPTKGK